MTMTRRDHLRGLLALGATAAIPDGVTAGIPDVPIPPQGIGRRIRHLSYSDRAAGPTACR